VQRAPPYRVIHLERNVILPFRINESLVAAAQVELESNV